MNNDSSAAAKPRLKPWVRYAIAYGISLAMATAITLSRGFSFSMPLYQNAGAVSDGCFVTGVLVMGVGLLLRIATTGFFDMLSYGMRSFLNLILPHKMPEKEPKFYDYKVAKAEKRGKPGYTLVIVGGSLLLIAGLGTWIFMSQMPA